MNISGPAPSIPTGHAAGPSAPSGNTSAQMGTSTVSLAQTAAQVAVKSLAMLQRDMGDQVLKEGDLLHRLKTRDGLKDVDSQFLLDNANIDKLRVPCHFVLDLNLAKQDQIRKLLGMLGTELRWVKLSAAFIAKHGTDLLDEIASMGFKIFLDLRLSTAQKTSLATLESLQDKSIQLLSIHLEGSKDNIRAFLAKKQDVLPYTQLIVRCGVGHTRRFMANDTSLQEGMAAYLDRLNSMLDAFKLKGMMCQTKDIAYFRQSFGPKVDIMVQEGISLKEGALGKMTPAQAAASGASYIVIAASSLFTGGDPGAIVRNMLDQIKGLD